MRGHNRLTKDATADFLLDPFEPAYLRLARNGGLKERANAAVARLGKCSLCPRACGAARLEGRTGKCETGRMASVASAFPHMGEEDCLRGRGGSGTIFFVQCNLHCVFCQNWDISHASGGTECGPEKIARLMLTLRTSECHNINFVTPTHVVPQMLEALAVAANGGLDIPLVYNCGGYETVETLKLLEGVVDVYMPDFKFWSRETSSRLADAPDYPERAREAVLEMHRQVGPLRFGPDGTARRGVLVRHLVMPGLAVETAEIMKWLASGVSRDTFVNIMGQYRPEHSVSSGREGAFRDINRRPAREEMAEAYGAARAAGLWRFAHPDA